MNEVILGALQLNQGLNYTLITSVILGYVVVFWIIVSIWVFIDAKKRFQSKFVGLLISLGNLIFQIPFLLLYLLFRPIEEEYVTGNEQQGGVNVPIVNFLGEDGIAMSLELRIHNRVTPQNASEMKIDVSFDDSKDEKKQLSELATKLITTTEDGSKVVNSKIASLLASLKSKLAKPKAPEEKANNDKPAESQTLTNATSNSKKKKKKNRK